MYTVGQRAPAGSLVILLHPLALAMAGLAKVCASFATAMRRTHHHKVKAFIVKRLRQVTCAELSDLAFDCGGDPFEFAKQFDHEVFRIERFLNFPLLEED